VVYELPTSNQWSFDVQWCPRNPGLISSSTFDGHVTVYSLMGGGHPIQPSNKVAESFNTGDPFSQSQAPVQVPHVEEKVMSLQKPPKWIRKPVGASFAFGGKLVTFECPPPGSPQQPAQPRVVRISQVVTETELVSRSDQLQQALAGGQFAEFCALKAANSTDAMQENIWNFLRVNFETDPRTRFLQLLGYDQNELAKKVAEFTGTDVAQPLSPGIDAKELAQKMSQLSAGDATSFGALSASGQASPSVGSKTPNSRDDLSDGPSAFDEIAAGSQGKESGMQTPLVIPTDNGGASSLMAQALLMGNFEAAVEMCLAEDKMAEAILLAIAGGPELLLRTQKKYFQRNKSNLGRLISSVVTHDWSHIVETCDLDNWKEALALILTYSLPEEFASLCDKLAARLETEKDGELSLYASLCYICSGNLEKLVENWVRNTENNNTPLALQDLVEKVMILRRAVETSRGQAVEAGDMLSERLSQYAGLLAAQGSLATASNYLRNVSNDIRLARLQDRVHWALGPTAPANAAVPSFPFQFVNVLPEGARAQPQPQQQVSRGGYQQQKRAVGSYQTQAGNFQTTTTPSNNYYGPTQTYAPSTMNGPAATHTTFTPQPPVSSTGITSKGPLSHKYPTPSYQQQNPGYGADTFSQPNIMQPDFSQTPAYSQPDVYSPTYPTTQAQPTNYYNPAATAPSYTPAVSTPGGPYSGTPMLGSYQDRKAETAWNDPPAILESKKSKSAPTYEAQAPITAPIFGVPQQPTAEQAPPGAPMNYGNYGNYGGIYNPQEHQPAPQPPSIPSYNPQPPSATTVPPAQTQPAKPAPEPPAPVVKGPVPTEHKVLQDVFGNLLNACSQRAANAQMKRKLEDVARKLEILYDKLRDGTLSQSVLLGLHQMVQAIQQYDYPSGLAAHTGLVSHSNFSEISAFMPALKVLMQIATQLNVYVQ
ncbi:hypothetical protein BaRGS_00007254, partial [Batillaria attramentaria]